MLGASRASQEMRDLVPLVAEFSQSQQLFSKVQAFTIEIDADRGTQSNFEAVCASSDDANTFATLLQATLLYQASHSGGSNPDLAALLGQAKVVANGDRLDVTVGLTDDQVVGLLESYGLSTQ